MVIILGVDLGTTKVLALAVDCASGQIIARAATSSSGETTVPADKARGYCEWDIEAIAQAATTCLHHVSEQLGPRATQVAGIGITGQQHGVVVVDERLKPLTPFVNWQDRRGEECISSRPGASCVRHLQELAGPQAATRTGCRLATGYLGVTLWWLKEHHRLPGAGTACFAADYFGALLSGTAPVTDPTCAASSGIFNVQENVWDRDLLERFALPESLFPRVVRSGERLGALTAAMARQTGLPAGVPVFAGIGDHQASFLGSVADKNRSVLVNVGTGGQVAAYTERFRYDASLETRPYPQGGYLLVSAGLSGGAVYAVLERFFRAVGEDLFGLPAGPTLFEKMNALAAGVAPGADGLKCEPFFFGTRPRPELRGSFIGVSAANFTPAHLTRALLEGMARTFADGYALIVQQLGQPRELLIGAGNGIRENPLLGQLVAAQVSLPLRVPHHHEEAAFGAGLLAAASAGVYPSLEAAAALIRYAE